MKAKDLFSVALKVIGLLSFGRGFNDLIYVLVRELGISDSSVTGNKVDANLLYGLVYFFGGLYLLRGAKLLVDFAFPGEVEVQNEKPVEGS